MKFFAIVMTACYSNNSRVFESNPIEHKLFQVFLWHTQNYTVYTHGKHGRCYYYYFTLYTGNQLYHLFAIINVKRWIEMSKFAYSIHIFRLSRLFCWPSWKRGIPIGDYGRSEFFCGLRRNEEYQRNLSEMIRSVKKPFRRPNVYLPSVSPICQLCKPCSEESISIIAAWRRLHRVESSLVLIDLS